MNQNKRSYLILTILCFCISMMSAQDRYRAINIGFYNLENLFDTIDSPNTLDSEFTPTGAKLYNHNIYTDKLMRLESVISKLGKEINPDGIAVLGVAEIENRKVLEDLVRQPALAPYNYQIVHYDSPDYRGVDVGLLYQPKYFEVLESKPFELPIVDNEGKKSPTRDILYVKGLLDGDTVHIMVNHWPSRRGGEAATEPLRMRGASICAHIKDSLIALNPDAKVIVMGDLNDDPTNKSLTKSLGAVGKKEKLKKNEMYNPYMDFYKNGIGTTAYRDAWSLFDQVVISPTWLKSNTYYFYKAHVFNERFITQQSGVFRGYPQRTFSGDTYIYGYSDHFPVYITVVKKE